MLTIINPYDPKQRTIYYTGHYNLVASKNIFVSALTFARIPHDIHIEITGRVWIVRHGPEVLEERGLLVDCGPVFDGPIYTLVFNMTNETVRISRGDSISRLEIID